MERKICRRWNSQLIIREEVREPTRLGLETGIAVFHAGALTRTVPKIDLVFEKTEARFEFGIGWFPADENRLGRLDNGYGELLLTWFPYGRWLGPSVGWVASSQFVREVTEYLQLDHGPTIGMTARFNHVLSGAVHLGYALIAIAVGFAVVRVAA